MDRMLLKLFCTLDTIKWICIIPALNLRLSTDFSAYGLPKTLLPRSRLVYYLNHSFQHKAFTGLGSSLRAKYPVKSLEILKNHATNFLKTIKIMHDKFTITLCFPITLFNLLGENVSLSLFHSSFNNFA